MRVINKKYTFHSRKEKLGIVKRYLSGESPRALSKELGISDGNIRKWKRQYLSGDEMALENKRKPSNPLSKYTRRKALSREEQLEYQVAVLKRGCRLSGAKKIRVHDLRHSHASLLIELGFSPLLIAERLGHEKIETTLNTYSHLYPNKQIEVAQRLNTLIALGVTYVIAPSVSVATA